MLGRERRREPPVAVVEERALDVTAAMQGTLSFKDPVNLQISGKFEGALDLLGTLVVGEQAQVEAQITGETIVIAGRVQGKVVAKRQMTLKATARVTAEVWTPRLAVEEGAFLDGTCHMTKASEASGAGGLASGASAGQRLPSEETGPRPSGPRTGAGQWLSVEEVAQYLELEPATVRQWAAQGRIPGAKTGEGWRFSKEQLDQWIASERAR